MLFRMWEAVNSYMYDDRMLDFISKLTEMHVAPEASDPRRIAEIPDDERSEDEGRPNWSGDVRKDLPDNVAWPGIYKDVGIFSEHEWHLVMCKCLASMGIVHHNSPRFRTHHPIKKFHLQMLDRLQLVRLQTTRLVLR
jgi:proteasome activator subunit 4